MKRSSPVLLLIAVVWQIVGASGCRDDCKAPRKNYTCLYEAQPKPGACEKICSDAGYVPAARSPGYETVCVNDASEASSKAQAKYAQDYPLWDVTIRECLPTAMFPAGGPGRYPQTLSPSCDPDPADDACVTCAKAACCDQYQACAGDTLCLCWVACNYEGNPDDVCAQPDHCGPLDGVSAAAATCIHTSCPSVCGGMESMAGACMCAPAGGGATGSSSSGGGCMPGPTGSGEPCFSDGDCASCICDPQTMICG